jgi:SAM-dependent methyltransferase
MSNLYKELAAVYEAMYQSFIDYQEEYILYRDVLEKYEKTEVLELGCGTGNLASYFIDNGFDYIGLDLSKEMLTLARTKTPAAHFMEGDMRSFKLEKAVQSVIITARTINYMLTNADLNNTFSNIYQQLEMGGILCFDFIDANQFVPLMAQADEIVHTAHVHGTTYIRKSKWNLRFDHGMDFHWDSSYYKEEAGNLTVIGQDHAAVRAFTRDELTIFLELQGFKVQEMMARGTYAFPTYVVVAEKPSKNENHLVCK